MGFVGASLMAQRYKSACNAGDAKDSSSIPGSGRSPEGGNGNSSQYPCLQTSWTEETGRLQSRGS